MNSTMLRQRARKNLKETWAVSIGVAALAFLLGGLMTGNTFLPNIDSNTEITVLQKLHALLEEGIRVGNMTFGFRSGLLGLVGFLLGGTIQLGYARFLLRQHDGESLDWHDLFSQFDRFGQGFAQAFLRDLYCFLWGLLLIIPGIIKWFSYAMTPYIMAEETELTASEAIEKSRLMMEGHKWELFVLHLSFIGWTILASLPLNLGHLVLNPYRNAADAAFYRELKKQHPYL